MLGFCVTLGHKLVQGPRRDPLLPAVHSLLSPTPRIRLSLFSDTCALFHFWDHSYPVSFPQVAHSSAKNRGYTPTGSYRASSFLFTLVYPERGRRAHLPQLQRRRAISFISPRYERQSRISFVSPTYAKTGGVPPPKNVGAPTFLIFPLIFRTFLALSAARRVTTHFLCYPIYRRPSRP